MFSQRNYLSHTPSIRLTSQTSLPTTNTLHTSPMRSQLFLHQVHQCIACQHQRKPLPFSSFQHQNFRIKLNQQNNRFDHKTQEDLQLANLKNAKLYLQKLLEKNQNQYQITIQSNNKKIIQLQEQIFHKDNIIDQLQQKINKLLQQNVSASIVAPYTDRIAYEYQQKQKDNLRIKKMTFQIKKLRSQLDELILRQSQYKKTLSSYEETKSKLKQYQIYALQYDSMKLLIHKMEIQKQQMLRSHDKAINQIEQRHQEQMLHMQEKCNETIKLIQNKSINNDAKLILTQKTRNPTISVTLTQYESLNELLEQRDKLIDQLQSNIACINSQLNFLKNRYGYLLKLVWNSPQENQLRSNSDLQQYCIERVGRHNLSNGKQSLIGLNLSPIKRR